MHGGCKVGVAVGLGGAEGEGRRPTCFICSAILLKSVGNSSCHARDAHICRLFLVGLVKIVNFRASWFTLG